jgi:ATP-dependent DNA helicase RecQ
VSPSSRDPRETSDGALVFESEAVSEADLQEWLALEPQPSRFATPPPGRPTGPAVEPALAPVSAAEAAARLPRVLRQFWGFDSLRPLQAEAMEAAIAGRDSLVVLPTGGGKSLCYQAPAVAAGGLTLVVSPLIALMKDQVDALVTHGVAAASYNSSLDPATRADVRRRLARRELSLLYVAPERLLAEGGAEFLGLVRGAGLRAIAVDEAHCISEWGHDFRPEYRQLGALRAAFPGVAFHAYTATATPRVRADIATELRLVDPLVLVGSVDRGNLVYRVVRRQQASRQVRAALDRHPGEAAIVYCTSRREVEVLAAQLADVGHRALAYHAGLADEERAAVQEAFLGERADVVVATVAFGMGIDRSDVRAVIHVGAPRSLEQYLQEAGRAGRDGLAAECLLLSSPGDFARWRSRLERDGADSEANRLCLRRMEAYTSAASCRHRALVEHFAETWRGGSCGACDWCLGELETVPGATVLAQKVLSCVARVRQGFGAGHVIDVLRGRITDRVRQLGHDSLSTFGLLVDEPVTDLRAVVDQLAAQELLAIEGDRYPILRLTDAGWDVLRGQREVTLMRVPAPPPRERGSRRSRDRGASRRGSPAVEIGPAELELFERLRALRREVASERGVPPYVIFHDTTLLELARARPRNERELLAVRGIGERKAADLGERLLAALAEPTTAS